MINCEFLSLFVNLLQTRLSDRNLLTVLSTATVQAPLQEICDIIKDYGNKPDWDPNFHEGRKVMDIGGSVELHYLRTKKIAVVSGRDQYLVFVEKWLPATASPSGRRTVVLAAKSLQPNENYPATEGCVRASTIISGWWVEELEPPSKGCLVHFLIESDFKISLFVQKQVAPRASNYAGRLKDYIEVQRGGQGSAAKDGADAEDH